MLEKGLHFFVIYFINDVPELSSACIIGADVNWYNLNGDGAMYLATYGILCRLQSIKNTGKRSSEIQLGILIIDSLLSSGILIASGSFDSVIKDPFRITGCPINWQNNSGFTSLHLAASAGEKWLVDHFLKRGADPMKKTALSYSLPSTFAYEKSACSVL